MKKWTRARFQPNLPLDGNGYVTAGPAHRALAREAMALGLVTRAGLEVRARRVLELILKTGWPWKIDFPISAKNPLFLFPNGQTCVILKKCMCVHFTLTKEECFHNGTFHKTVWNLQRP